jgi:succinyl-CoA synthetase alpha subunit
MNPITGLNATFRGAMARPGSVGLLSQSGALLTAILDRSFRENIGFSSIVSVGTMMDVGWGDLIYHLGDDPKTKSIVVYMESVGDARSFLSAAREVALTKPIIVIKAAAPRRPARPRPPTRAPSRARTRCSTRPSPAAASCAWTRSPSSSPWPRSSASSPAPAARA